MKHLHKFQNVNDFNEVYNSSGRYNRGVVSMVVNNITFYYDAETTEQNFENNNSNPYTYVSEDEEYYIHTETMSPYVGQYMSVFPDNASYPITELTLADGSKTQGLYKEPFVGLVAGNSKPIFNRRPIGVDLGLPSGLIWASCNVGARFPEDLGYYFAWGETTPKNTYTWNNYRYGTSDSLIKYTDSNGLYLLESCDDAATAILGPKWRTPTLNECWELISYTSISEKHIHGVPCCSLTGNDDNEILIPQWASIIGDTLQDSNSYAHYWTASLSDELTPYMLGWCHAPTYMSPAVHNPDLQRYIGCQIRAVREPDDRVYVPYIHVE